MHEICNAFWIWSQFMQQWVGTQGKQGQNMIFFFVFYSKFHIESFWWNFLRDKHSRWPWTKWFDLPGHSACRIVGRWCHLCHVIVLSTVSGAIMEKFFYFSIGCQPMGFSRALASKYSGQAFTIFRLRCDSAGVGIEPPTSQTRSGRANHYSTDSAPFDALCQMWFVFLSARLFKVKQLFWPSCALKARHNIFFLSL